MCDTQLTKQLITIAPRSWHSAQALWKTHQHPIPHPADRTAKQLQGRGEGHNFNKWGCFVHTRAGSEVFWLNSVSLEMQQQGGKGELF